MRYRIGLSYGDAHPNIYAFYRTHGLISELPLDSIYLFTFQCAVHCAVGLNNVCLKFLSTFTCHCTVPSKYWNSKDKIALLAVELDIYKYD